MTVDPATKSAITAETSKQRAALAQISSASAAIEAIIATAPPVVVPPVIVPPPPPPPPVNQFSLEIQDSAMRLVGPGVITGSAIKFETTKAGHTGTGSVGYWGAVGEAVEFDLESLTSDTTDDVITLRYGNGNAADAHRELTILQGTLPILVTLVTFPFTGTWETAQQWGDKAVTVRLPQGKYVCRLKCLANGEYLDLDRANIKSSTKVSTTIAPTVPAVPAPSVVVPPPLPVPPTTGKVWNVPNDGSLQTVVNQARGGDRIEVSGIVADGGKLMNIANRDNGPGKEVVIVGLPGHVLRGGQSGFEGYGSCRGWRMLNLNVEVNGTAYYGEGFYFGGMRADQGGDGKGCERISILNCKVRPIAGTGIGQRNGICVWGGDLVEVGFCDVADFSYNDLGFLGGAGSGISIGVSIGSATTGSLNCPIPNTRTWIHDNTIKGMRGPGSGAYDRNAIILDMFHGSPGNGLNANRARGAVVIELNKLSDCEGRAVQLLEAGTEDSPIYVLKNTVRGSFATNLAGSNPITAIGGYGDGRCGNVTCSDNDVLLTNGVSAYEFQSFDAGFDASIRGVRGSGNKGGPVRFINSPTNTPPSGFTV